MPESRRWTIHLNHDGERMPSGAAEVSGDQFIEVVPRSELDELHRELGLIQRLQEEHDMLLVERASLSDEVERLRGLLAEAAHYLDSCGCDDDHCPGRQKAAQLHAALSGPAGLDNADG